MFYRKTYASIDSALAIRRTVQRIKISTANAPTDWGATLKAVPKLKRLELIGEPSSWIEKGYSIPMEVGELIQLQHLSILNVAISEIPEWLADLKNLRTLVIRGTDIKEVPTLVLSLKKLRDLRVENCPVENVDFPLTPLIKLEHLGFADTLINDIPPGHLPGSLKSIALGNPNRYYKKEALENWKNR